LMLTASIHFAVLMGLKIWLCLPGLKKNSTFK
jgi:hypothetical protein